MARVTVVHKTPGRLRVRLPPGAARSGLQKAVQGYRGVTHSSVSPRTRSLLVRYRTDETTADTIVRALEAAVAKFLIDPAEGDEAMGPELPPPFAVSLQRGVGRLNASVATATRGHLDLRVLIALGMAGWGVWKLTRRQRGWHQPIWYAYSLFMDYHPSPTTLPMAHAARTRRPGQRAGSRGSGDVA